MAAEGLWRSLNGLVVFVFVCFCRQLTLFWNLLFACLFFSLSNHFVWCLIDLNKSYVLCKLKLKKDLTYMQKKKPLSIPYPTTHNSHNCILFENFELIYKMLKFCLENLKMSPILVPSLHLEFPVNLPNFIIVPQKVQNRSCD